MCFMKSIDLRSLWNRGKRSAVLAGVFGTGIRAGANLLLIPIVLIKLSSAELALWWVFVALGNFGNLADLGFGSTIHRIYNYLLAGADDFEAEGLREAKAAGPPNFEGISRLNATVRSLYLKISMGAMVLLGIGGTLSLLKPAAESGFTHKVWWLWAAYMVAIGYNLATSHWLLAVQGLNRVRDLQLAYVLGGVSFVSCAALLLFCKMGLLSMVIATFVKGFIMHGRCHQIYRQVVPKPKQCVMSDAHIVRKLWPNAYKFGILSIGSYCLTNGSILICSQILGKDITASFGLTVQIGYSMTNFAALWLTVKWPEITILRTQGRLEEMAVLFARRIALVMASFVAMGLIILVAGNALLAWKGTHTRLLPAACLSLYLMYLAQQLFYGQFGILACSENVVPFFKVSIFTGLIACAVSLGLTPVFGLWGLLASPMIVESAYSSWFTIRCGFQGQPLSPRRFVFAAIRGHNFKLSPQG
jgi:O-antigen/teichoic acid export membrane protein